MIKVLPFLCKGWSSRLPVPQFAFEGEFLKPQTLNPKPFEALRTSKFYGFCDGGSQGFVQFLHGDLGSSAGCRGQSADRAGFKTIGALHFSFGLGFRV